MADRTCVNIDPYTFLVTYEYKLALSQDKDFRLDDTTINYVVNKYRCRLINPLLKTASSIAKRVTLFHKDRLKMVTRRKRTEIEAHRQEIVPNLPKLGRVSGHSRVSRGGAG